MGGKCYLTTFSLFCFGFPRAHSVKKKRDKVGREEGGTRLGKNSHIFPFCFWQTSLNELALYIWSQNPVIA